LIPLKDNNPTRRFPVVSVTLILLNVAVFLADRLTGHYELAHVRTPYGYVRAAHFVGGLSEQYAMIPADVTADLPVAWITLFTSMFLHANWLHIGGNMLYLWIFGNNIEDTLGRFRFLLFYLVSGVGAAAAHILANPTSDIPTVGASGAVAGVMGAYLILFPHAQILSLVTVGFFTTLMEIPAILVIGLWALIQFVNVNWLGGGEMLRGGGVAYLAHIGGFLAGIALIYLFGGQRLLERRRARYDDYYYSR
jgi:membrane associated rhomboid family serine protease